MLPGPRGHDATLHKGPNRTAAEFLRCCQAQHGMLQRCAQARMSKVAAPAHSHMTPQAQGTCAAWAGPAVGAGQGRAAQQA